jgi:hypothetical protein
MMTDESQEGHIRRDIIWIGSTQRGGHIANLRMSPTDEPDPLGKKGKAKAHTCE